MEDLNKLLNSLDQTHKLKLEWFLKNKGKEILWSETKPGNNKLKGEISLFSAFKGIYKPEREDYVLSFRELLTSKYSDQTPTVNQDGSWIYRYKEELGSKQTEAPEDLFSNIAAKRCMEDKVPVGVAIQISKKPNPTKYMILGLGVISEWVDGFFVVNGFSDIGTTNLTETYGPSWKEQNDVIEPIYDLKSTKDERDRVLREVVQRRGQKKFRNKLLHIYKNTCVITKCGVPAVLEASHITPYLGEKSNHPSNGLLLRADIHTLWDQGLIAINPADMKVNINQALYGSIYEEFHLLSLDLDFLDENQPSIDALKMQWDYFNYEVSN